MLGSFGHYLFVLSSSALSVGINNRPNKGRENLDDVDNLLATDFNLYSIVLVQNSTFTNCNPCVTHFLSRGVYFV